MNQMFGEIIIEKTRNNLWKYSNKDARITLFPLITSSDVTTVQEYLNTVQEKYRLRVKYILDQTRQKLHATHKKQQ